MPKKLNSVILNVILLVMGVITVYPFIWMILSSFKQNQEIMALDQKLLPEQFTIQNYINMNERFDFMRFFFNSVIVTIVVTILVIFFLYSSA